MKIGSSSYGLPLAARSASARDAFLSALAATFSAASTAAFAAIQAASALMRSAVRSRSSSMASIASARLWSRSCLAASAFSRVACASSRRRASSSIWGRWLSIIASARRSVASRSSINRSRTIVSSLTRASARKPSASWLRSLAASSIAECRAASRRPSSLRAWPIADWIENSASRPLNVMVSPAGQAAFECHHPELRLHEAAALLRHACILHDSVPGLVVAHGVESIDRDAHRETRNCFHLVGLVVSNRQLDRLALGVESVDHDEIGASLEARMLAPEAGLILRAPRDPQHVFLPQQSQQSVQLGHCRTRIRGVAALERGTTAGQDRIGALARLRYPRFPGGGLVGRGQLAGQRFADFDPCSLGCAVTRPNHRVVIETDADDQRRQRPGHPFSVGPPLDPEGCQRAAEAGRRRGVDEAAVLERLDALRDDAVGHLDALALVEGAQPLDQLLLAQVLVEFPLHQPLVVAERVDHVHRQHHVIQRRGGGGAGSCGDCGLGRRHQSGSAFPSATSLAIRRLPSSTASRISTEFLVASWRISPMISVDRSWYEITESTSF